MAISLGASLATPMSRTAYPSSFTCPMLNNARHSYSLKTKATVPLPIKSFCSLKISTPPFSFAGGESTLQWRKPKRNDVFVVMAARKKVDSAAKRHRQSEKRRMINKSRKSEMRTRMKKVLRALFKLRKSRSPNPEDIPPIENQISEAYSAIDKAVRVGAIHRNTGARRKSRLARNKRAVLIRHGWYKPAAAT
eukprot:TRINITY_DN2936_c0_g1_i1.p1 TRINITY_DN2936_c0_g1~~TRINITY_DN2936_c0_g1_i1.p1  ORF type:complete len:193 (+),score=27.94 TRINITY_DN2936_c0_g1_i1:96-674(+)